MHKTMLKATGLLLVLVWSNLAGAVGLGGINVSSALGRPLKAEIALVSLENADKASLAVRLASPSDFKSAGIDYPYGLPKLSFEIETRANGDAYVTLTSSQPVNEPFVSLLLELSWSSGRMLREYTFLLDPEGFAPEQPKAHEVQPVAPVTAAEPVPAEPVPAESAPAAVPDTAVTDVAPVPVLAAADAGAEPAPAEALVPAEQAPGLESEQLVAASAPQPDVTPDMEAKDLAAETQTTSPAAEAAAPAQKTEIASEAINVKRGDTLGKIAAQVKPVDVSLERMVVALYHANTKEFDGKNMNRLRAGKILKMPESDAVAKVTQKAAVKEIRAQVADWHAYRQQLAAAQGKAPEQTAKREDAGKITAAVADKAPAAKEPAKEVLKLSKGEAPGDKQIAAGAMSKEDKRIAKEDEALARKKQEQEEQKRAEELKKIGEQASKLVELKAQPAASAPAAAPVAASAVQPAPKADKPKTIIQPQPVAAPPSLLDDLLGDPIMLGGVAAALLALGGLGFVAFRRLRSKGGKKKNELKKEFKIEPLGSATGSWATPVPPSPETGDFTQAAEKAAAPAAAPTEDDIDPIGEAELFLNFGRDAQAEEVLKDALAKNPGNIPVKLKLLSIYANRKDANTFSRYAREIQQSGDNAAWEQAAAMGRSIDPSNPIYGGASDAPVASTAAPAAHEPSVDFDLGFGKPAEVAAPAAKEFAMDFDVTGTHPGISDAGAHATGGVVDVSGVLPGEVARAAQDTPMDFDVSGILPGEVLKSAQKAEMDFDISSSMSATGGIDETVSSMDFDVTGGNVGAKAPEAAPTMDFGDLVFEVPGSTPAKEAAPAPQAAPAIDLGMPFTLDFPSSEPAAAPKAAEPKLDIDFADINLDLEATAVQPRGVAEAASTKDEHWHEVATKLDLAKAYQEMGDAAGAREILDEVVREGDAEQRETAEKLLQQLA